MYACVWGGTDQPSLLAGAGVDVGAEGLLDAGLRERLRTGLGQSRSAAGWHGRSGLVGKLTRPMARTTGKLKEAGVEWMRRSHTFNPRWNGCWVEGMRRSLTHLKGGGAGSGGLGPPRGGLLLPKG